MSFWIAFSAGVISFLSPCTLPLIPFYISYITGKSLQDINDKKHQRQVFLHSLFFLLGIMIVYFSLGISIQLLKSVLTGFVNGPISNLLQKAAGILVIVMGLSLTGLIKVNLLLSDKRQINFDRSINYSSSFLIGVGFGAGWTPCIGPIFSSILILGDSTMGFLLAYLVGFAVPFLFISLFISKAKVLTKYSALTMKIGAIVLVLMGILVYTGELQRMTLWLSDLLNFEFFKTLG